MGKPGGQWNWSTEWQESAGAASEAELNAVLCRDHPWNNGKARTDGQEVL